MPALLDTRTRTDELVTASWWLIDDGGVQAVTLRRLADRAGVTPSTILHQFTNRERLVRVLAWRTGQRYRRGVEDRLPEEGITAFLPRDDEDLVVLRAWLAWSELGRGDVPLGEALEAGHEQERMLLHTHVDGASGIEPEHWLVDAALALVRGVQLAVTLRPGATDLGRARHALRTASTQLVEASAAARSSAIIRSGSSAE